MLGKGKKSNMHIRDLSDLNSLIGLLLLECILDVIG